MFHKVIEVFPLPDMKLSVLFANGTTKTYDVTSLVDTMNAFRPLEDELLFGKVKVDAGGYGVSWNDEIDLSCDELWNVGVAFAF